MRDLLARFLPARRYTVLSRLSPSDIEARLRAQVGGRRNTFYGVRAEGDKAWAGSVDAGRASLERVIHYRNSMRPLVTLTWEATESGTRVHVRAELRPFVQRIALVISFASVGNGILISVLSFFATPAAPNLAPWWVMLPLQVAFVGIGPAFVFLLTRAGFVTEERKARMFIESVADAPLVSSLARSRRSP